MASMTQYLQETSAFLNKQLEARQDVADVKQYLCFSTYFTQPGIHLSSLTKKKLLSNLKVISA